MIYILDRILSSLLNPPCNIDYNSAFNLCLRRYVYVSQLDIALGPYVTSISIEVTEIKCYTRS